MYCSMTINNLETNYSCMRPWVRQNKCIPTGHINMFCLVCSSWGKQTKTPSGYKIGCLFTNMWSWYQMLNTSLWEVFYSQWVGVFETKQQRDDTFTQTCIIKKYFTLLRPWFFFFFSLQVMIIHKWLYLLLTNSLDKQLM